MIYGSDKEKRLMQNELFKLKLLLVWDVNYY